ncbi:MAG: hypothetical protein WCK09_15310 [Bacteroidota bacterium]
MPKKRMSKTLAYKLAKDYGIKFNGDFHKDCSVSDGIYLASLAKVVGYKKPATSSGSIGSCFYGHLFRKFAR